MSKYISAASQQARESQFRGSTDHLLCEAIAALSATLSPDLTGKINPGLTGWGNSEPWVGEGREQGEKETGVPVKPLIIKTYNGLLAVLAGPDGPARFKQIVDDLYERLPDLSSKSGFSVAEPTPAYLELIPDEPKAAAASVELPDDLTAILGGETWNPAEHTPQEEALIEVQSPPDDTPF